MISSPSTSLDPGCIVLDTARDSLNRKTFALRASKQIPSLASASLWRHQEGLGTEQQRLCKPLNRLQSRSSEHSSGDHQHARVHPSHYPHSINLGTADSGEWNKRAGVVSKRKANMHSSSPFFPFRREFQRRHTLFPLPPANLLTGMPAYSAWARFLPKPAESCKGSDGVIHQPSSREGKRGKRTYICYVFIPCIGACSPLSLPPSLFALFSILEWRGQGGEGEPVGPLLLSRAEK